MVRTCGPRWALAGLPSFRELQREFDHAFGKNGGSAVRATADVQDGLPPASLWEEEGQLRLDIDLPGVALEEVELTIEKGVLRVQAERKSPEGRTYLHNARSFGKFAWSLALPETIDPEAVTAEMKQGVLQVVMGKRPETQPKKIVVKAE